MAITKMNSYDLKGVKLSFADWISNISPTETPFCSMTGKESISQTKFQWQTDIIPAVKVDNDAACIEGSTPKFDDPFATKVETNNTQIFRRAVSVSDTANVVAYYGRGKEIGYQMEKASLELKRDMEKTFLSAQEKADAQANTGGKTACFEKLCVAVDTLDPDTQAKLHFKSKVAKSFTEENLFEMTYNLYLANSKANIIMFHPSLAGKFSSLLSVTGAGTEGNRMKMFKSMDDQYNVEVDTIIDPLGQKFALVPNRLMPDDALYFFNPSDWTQMVLRAPKRIQLAKVGSSEEWMIETEIGLRHRNKAASAILKLAA